MLKATLVGKTGHEVDISSQGELAINARHRNLAEFNELAEDNTAYNFYKPQGTDKFVITHIFAFGDKQVNSASNASVVVYEATTASTTTVSKQLLTFEIGQNEFQPYQDLNLLVNANRFINAKTDDDDVHMNILGYYIPEE